MTALLALLAVAGYQNRDKLAEMFGRVAGTAGGGAAGRSGGERLPEAGAGAATPAASIGAMLSEGLSDLVDRFRQAGQGETAESWVRPGPNAPLAGDQLEAAIGPDTLETLARQTGLPREEILARLTRELPDAVDRYTPEGRLPEA